MARLGGVYADDDDYRVLLVWVSVGGDDEHVYEERYCSLLLSDNEEIEEENESNAYKDY